MPAQPPVINVTFQDGALGQQPASSASVQIKFGSCSVTTTPQIIPITSSTDALNYLGNGPLASACAYTVNNTGGQVFAVPCAASIAGTNGTVTGTSSPALTAGGTPKDAWQVSVKIVAGGGTSNTTALYQVSLDNGNTWSQTATCVATAITLYEPITGLSTGVTITFATGTYAAGQQWYFATTAPCPSGSDFTAAWNVAIADPRTWGLAHFVGADITGASDAANCTTSNTLAGTIDGLVQAAAAAKRYVQVIVEAPDQKASLASSGVTDLTNNMQTTTFDTALFAVHAPRASANGRLHTAAGYADLADPMTGLVRRRSAAWPIVTRLGQGSVADDPGCPGNGSLPGVVRLWRDERNQPGADAARLMSLRTWQSYAGFFATSGISLASPGSDYSYIANARVLDVFATALYMAAVPFVNQRLRCNANGTLFETDARVVESVIGNAGYNAVIQAGYASPPTPTTPLATVSRAVNFLSTGQLLVTGRATALGYARDIELYVGFNRASLIAATQ